MSNELNERVAVAMGWHVGYSDHAPGLPYRRVQWRDYEKHCGDTSEVRDYATDPATIPEMLAWLKSQCVTGQRICMTSIDEGWMADIERLDLIDDVYDTDITASGDTLNLALANLVIAVAEEAKTP